MDPTPSEIKWKRARTVYTDSWQCSLYYLDFESQPPPSPFWVVSSLPTSPLPFMPSDQLLPTVLTFHHPLLASPGACIPPRLLSNPSLAPFYPPCSPASFAITKQQIILHFNFDPEKHKLLTIKKNLPFPACTVEINCLMTCILSNLAVD